MQENQERWMELCKQAAIEEDPERLSDLIKEINMLLAAKEKRVSESRNGK